jgi:hypothetical protein
LPSLDCTASGAIDVVTGPACAGAITVANANALAVITFHAAIPFSFIVTEPAPGELLRGERANSAESVESRGLLGEDLVRAPISICGIPYTGPRLLP